MAGVCSIAVISIYRKYRAYEHVAIPTNTRNWGSETLAVQHERGAIACQTLCKSLRGEDFLGWTGPERKTDLNELIRWPRVSKSCASGEKPCARQLNRHRGRPILLQWSKPEVTAGMPLREAVNYKSETPFDNIESALEYVNHLFEATREAHDQIGKEIVRAANPQLARRKQALQLVNYKLDKLSSHIAASRRILNDLRTLRRLLLEERKTPNPSAAT